MGAIAEAALSVSTIVADLIAQCPAGAPLDTRAALAAHPELTNHKSALMELAYEEFCQCDELGMPVEPAEFAARFPTITRSLLHQIEVHRLVEGENAARGAAAPPAWPGPGTVWLNFEVLEELGRGAFSRVYLARELSLGDRLVVVKATPLGPREAHTLGRLRHPHVVPVHSVQRDDRLELTAVCMPYLSRVSLFDVMDALWSVPRPIARAADLLEAVRRLNAATAALPDEAAESPWPRHWSFADAVLQIGLQLAQALQHAHRQRVVHGDVKPSNVLITNSGRAVLLDFNLAIYGTDSTPLVTGTLPYMAPEQLRPLAVSGPVQEQAVDERTDIFSLGMTLFELLYGQPAFGTIPDETCRSRLAARLLERQKCGPKVPPGRHGAADGAIGKIIARCLEFDPALRPQSMEELAALLSAQLKTRPRVARWLRGHRGLTIGTAALVCASVAALAGWQASRDPYPIRKWQEGVAAFERGEYAQAMLDLSEVLDHNPSSVQARMLRARIYLRQQNFGGAYADLEPLIHEAPDGRAAAGLAHVYTTLDADSRAAVAYYERAVDQGYRSALVYNNLGHCLDKVARFRDAEDALKKSILLDPHLAAPRHNLARVEFHAAAQKRRAPDLEPIKDAIQFGPETGQLYLDAARTYALCSKHSKDNAARREFHDEVFWAMNRGLNFGFGSKDLRDISGIDSSLKADARWQDLEKRVPSQAQLTMSEILLDPFSDTSPQEKPPATAAIASR